MAIRWTTSFDIVVVGTGVTAGPALEEILTDSATRRIAVVERGEMWDPAEPHRLGQVRGRQRDATTSLLFSAGAGRVEPLPAWWASGAAGGGALLWYGQMSRFDSCDLRMRSLFGDRLGSEVRDWALDYSELQELYDEVQRRLPPVGSSYGHSVETYAHFDGGVYRDRGTPSHFERRVIDRLQESGFSPYVGQTCTGGRAWDMCPVSPITDEVRDPAAPLVSRPNWYVRLYGRLATDQRVTVFDKTQAVKVLVDRGEVRGVECLRVDGDETGAAIQLKTPAVVLACGPLETARVLLSSELPDRNNLIGKRVTFTTERVGYLLTDEPRSAENSDRLAGLYGNVVVKDFYRPADDVLLSKGGKFALYDAFVAETPVRHVRNLRLIGPELGRYLRDARNHYVIKVSFKGESIPSPEKRLSLSAKSDRFGVRKLKIHYRPHEADQHLQARVPAWFHGLGDALGADRRILHPPPAGVDLVSAHHHGGAVFGAHARDAVLTSDCECYEARGLFVADASFMPTSGATNASLTAMANALSVGRTVVTRL